MRVTLLNSIALICLLATGAGAQDSSTKGRELINKALAALGGDKFLHMQNRVETGRIYSFFHDELSGLGIARDYVEYGPYDPAHGLALRLREVLGKKQDYSYLFLADQAWDITFRGARPIPDENWQRYARTTQNDVFYILRYRLNEPGMQFDYVGTDIYVGRHIEVLDITDAKDQTVRVYLDHNTLYPIHQSFNWLDADTKQHDDEVTDYDKFRDAGDGVMWPFVIQRFRNGYKVYELYADSVQVNQSIPARTFELPPGAKKLKKVD